LFCVRQHTGVPLQPQHSRFCRRHRSRSWDTACSVRLPGRRASMTTRSPSTLATSSPIRSSLMLTRTGGGVYVPATASVDSIRPTSSRSKMHKHWLYLVSACMRSYPFECWLLYLNLVSCREQ